MASFLPFLATLLVSYKFSSYPGVALGIYLGLGTLCVILVGIYWVAYLRTRSYRQVYGQIVSGRMDSSVPVKDRPGVMIGAWGFGFFESDHDYDVADHLGADMGISKYSSNRKMQDSLLNPKNRAFIVKHIQQPTELDRVFKKYHDMLKDYKVIDIKATRKEAEMIDSPRYYIFLLGLLAMQLGCTLSRKHLRWMKANWNGCLFMYERRDQAKMAAFEYRNGKPLKLGSKTLHEKMMTMTDNEKVNVPNNAVQVSIMRMHLDNEVAKGKGATATKGADISNAFANETSIAALEQAATEKAKNCVVGEASNESETSKAAAQDSKIEIMQWASHQGGWDRLEQYGRDTSGASVNNVSREEMTKLLGDLINKGKI